MPTPRSIPSIASLGDAIGREAALHLDLLWRDMMKSQGSIESESFFQLITGEEHPLGNLTILRESSDGCVIESAVAPLLNISKPTAILFVAGVTTAVTESLTSRGFSKVEPMPAMAVDIASLASTTLPAGYEFIRVLSTEDGTAWANVVSEGFQLPRGLARLLSPEVHGASSEPDAQVQFFGIRRRRKMVATTMLYLANGLAGIYSVATLPEERGKGLGAHVTAEALRVAKQIGYGVGVLQSSGAGHSVYLSLGFRDVEYVSMFIRMPGSSLHATVQSNAA